MHDHDPRDEGDEEVAAEELEAEILRADRASGAESFGTTAEEEAAGEGLDRALARERPDRRSTDESLTIVDEGVTDEEDELVGDAVEQRDEFAPPEDAAVSEREDAPGATDHDDPHPVDDD
ncbi:MAG TPA: hypothetical protein VF028_08430 [Actinomycetota bacterium]|nr:hypothetical protein [Actinomycetota bacterium]